MSIPEYTEKLREDLLDTIASWIDEEGGSFNMLNELELLLHKEKEYYQGKVDDLQRSIDRLKIGR